MFLYSHHHLSLFASHLEGVALISRCLWSKRALPVPALRRWGGKTNPSEDESLNSTATRRTGQHSATTGRSVKKQGQLKPGTSLILALGESVQGHLSCLHAVLYNTHTEYTLTICLGHFNQTKKKKTFSFSSVIYEQFLRFIEITIKHALCNNIT